LCRSVVDLIEEEGKKTSFARASWKLGARRNKVNLGSVSKASYRGFGVARAQIERGFEIVAESTLGLVRSFQVKLVNSRSFFSQRFVGVPFFFAII